MALIKCKECEKQISSSAKICPHCGAKVKKIGYLRRFLIIFFVIILVLITYEEFFNYGTELTFNKGQLFYTSSVSKEEAKKLGKYLVEQDFFDGNEKTVQLNKAGNTYQFRMVAKKGVEKDPVIIPSMKQFCRELSWNVFDGARVEIHLCNSLLITKIVVIPE